ncbi:MAG: sulfite exporter TauE/SafE family protein [Acidobacteria bacterium]|nr:MAG: sulfite exporter TauE/SafE family protein [Acidobacteriota bacterium]REK08344.1 MAG: sulfite exporter TauE/SafE family protein [Acidobacteriota bacterium]
MRFGKPSRTTHGNSSTTDHSPLHMTPTLLLAACVVAAASALQGTVGIGLGMVAAPILLLIAPQLVPAPLLMANFALALLVSLRDRRGMRIAEIGPAIVGRFPGALVGAALVAWLAAGVLDVVLGSLLLGSVVLATLQRTALPMTRRNLVGAGFVSGITGTAVSVGGPPIALVVRSLEGERLRGTLSGYFFVGGTLSLIVLAAYGQIGRAELATLTFMVPATLLGYAASTPLIGRVRPEGVRTAILVLSGATSALVLARGLLRLLS